MQTRKFMSLVVLAGLFAACSGCGKSNPENDPVPSKFSISGTVSGAADVTVTLSGAATGTTVTNSSGTYQFAGLLPGDYTVTPSKTGFTFDPVSRQVTVSIENVAADFTATATTADTAPVAPVLSVGFGLKQLDFSWNAASGATYYKLLENPDGISSYQPVGGDLTVTTATVDVSVHRFNWAAARYKVQACNEVGCTDSNEVSPAEGMLSTIGYFKASNTRMLAEFGYAVSLSGDGNTLAVGADQESSDAGGSIDSTLSLSGAVYVFARSGRTWAFQAFLKASNAVGGDHFGHAISLSADGNTLAVGAVGKDSSAGAVCMFSRTGTVWAQQDVFKASNADSYDNFGSAVSLSADGNALAVSAPMEDSNATGIGGDGGSNGALDSGAVYIFSREGSTWAQKSYIKASNTGGSNAYTGEQGDLFGTAVSLAGDGNTLAVGANNEASNAKGIDGNQKDNSLVFSGAVYVFARAGNTWVQQAYVKASNAGEYDQFGYAVSLSGDGNMLAVGAQYESGNSLLESGAAYVFLRTGTAWAQQAYLKASNKGVGDAFGCAVSLSGDGSTLAVGAYNEYSNAMGIGGAQTDDSVDNAGAAYVFSWTGTNWEQQAYVKASNTGQRDYFGNAVSLSANGSTLAVGAFWESSRATGIGGDQANDGFAYSGAVYLY